MYFEPETYSIRLGKEKKFLRIRKEPFGCSIFDTGVTCEANKSFYYILEQILIGKRASIIDYIVEDVGISEEDAVKGYNAFVKYFLRRKWITTEDDLDTVKIIDYKTLPPLELDSVYNMAPNSIDFHVTIRCNLACPHCNLYERIKNEDYDSELSTEEWFRVLNELDKNGCMQILITGGEPFLRDDLFDIIEYTLNNTCLFIVINTNGILWNEEKVKRFVKKAKDRGKIIISLDGHTPATYGAARKFKNGTPAEKCFEKAIATAEWTAKYKGQLGFNFVLSRPTYDHSLDTARWTLEQFPDSTFNVLRFDVTDETKKGLDLTYRKWKQWLYSATSLKDHYNGRFTISLACGGELYLPLKGDEKTLATWRSNIVTPLSSALYRSRREVGCHAAVTDLSIAPDGTLYGCGLYTDHKKWYVGDLSSDSFYTIWHHGEHIKKFRDLNLQQIHAPCSKCPILQVCGGGCRGRAMVATGDMYGPDPYCPYAWRNTHD